MRRFEQNFSTVPICMCRPMLTGRARLLPCPCGEFFPPIAYYNQARPHLALQKAPLHRAVQRSGAIVAGWAASPVRPDMIFGKDR